MNYKLINSDIPFEFRVTEKNSAVVYLDTAKENTELVKRAVRQGAYLENEEGTGFYYYSKSEPVQDNEFRTVFLRI